MHFVSKFRRGTIAGACALGLLAFVGTVRPQSPQNVGITATPRALEVDPNRGAAALWQTLLKLHTRASLIMIVAHPDDEDGGMLAYESRGQGARAALLTLNRGEAGQNLMNSDYWEALGLDRTEELLAADQYYGTNQYFSRVIDFGFSKSKEETLQEWTHERVLGDVVRVVRMVRPLIVTSVFVGGPSDGHGHHQVSGETAQEAFKDAGDPNMFPDQIREGLRPWTPLKDYARVPTFAVRGNEIWDYANGRTYPLRFYNYISGQWTEGQLSTNVVIPEGDYDPLLGASFAQIARQGLGFQKTQNGGINPPPPGPDNSAYHLFASRVPVSEHEDSLFSGIDVTLGGIAELARGQSDDFLKQGLEKLTNEIDQAMKQFDARRPESIAPVLAEGAKANLALIDQVEGSSLSADAKFDVLHELRIKQAQFNTALAESLGLDVTATVTPAHQPGGPFARFLGPADTSRVAIPGESFFLNVRAADQGNIPVTIQRVWVQTPEGESWTVAPAPNASAPSSLDAGKVAAELFRVKVAEDAAYTRPYFSTPNVKQAYYDINNPKDLTRPFAPYPVSGWVEFEYQGVSIHIGQVAQTLQRVVGLGQVGEPLVIAPAISLSISPPAGIVPLGANSFPVSVLVHSNVKGPVKGTVRIDLPSGWRSDPDTASFSLAKDGENQSLTFEVLPVSVQTIAYHLQAVAEFDGRQYREGYQKVGYTGLRPYNLYRPANYKVNGVDVKIAPGLKVAYVGGTGDQVPQTMEDLGLDVTFLSREDIASGNLSQYDVIILGGRAYSARPELATYNQRLLDYVHQGGDLIVQYEASEYDHNFGPYPFNLGRSQTVTEENSAVQFLLPQNPALVWPNKIDQQDFQGWIEERGHGFPESWDPRWQAPLEMHDAGQAPQKGGVLVAPYGKGVYVYAALALYRQLPDGVPGAFRIFANLVSLPRNPGINARRRIRSRSRRR
jgi:LmbE family N-acetylglucosaminyl deacetylase